MANNGFIRTLIPEDSRLANRYSENLEKVPLLKMAFIRAFKSNLVIVTYCQYFGYVLRKILKIIYQ